VPIRIWIQPDPLPRGATDKLDRRTIQATCHGDFVSSEGKN